MRRKMQIVLIVDTCKTNDMIKEELRDVRDQLTARDGRFIATGRELKSVSTNTGDESYEQDYERIMCRVCGERWLNGVLKV